MLLCCYTAAKTAAEETEQRQAVDGAALAAHSQETDARLAECKSALAKSEATSRCYKLCKVALGVFKFPATVAAVPFVRALTMLAMMEAFTSTAVQRICSTE